MDSVRLFHFSTCNLVTSRSLSPASFWSVHHPGRSIEIEGFIPITCLRGSPDACVSQKVKMKKHSSETVDECVQRKPRRSFRPIRSVFSGFRSHRRIPKVTKSWTIKLFTKVDDTPIGTSSTAKLTSLSASLIEETLTMMKNIRKKNASSHNTKTWEIDSIDPWFRLIQGGLRMGYVEA